MSPPPNNTDWASVANQFAETLRKNTQAVKDLNLPLDQSRQKFLELAKNAGLANESTRSLANALSIIGQTARNTEQPFRVFGGELESFKQRFAGARLAFIASSVEMLAAFRSFVGGVKVVIPNIEALKDITIKMSEMVRGAFGGIYGKIRPILGMIEYSIEGTLDLIERVIVGGWDKIYSNVAPIVSKLSGYIGSVWESVSDRLKSVTRGISYFVGDAFGVMSSRIVSVLGKVEDNLGWVGQAAGKFAAGAMLVASSAVSGISGMTKLAGAIAGELRMIAEGATRMLSGPVHVLDAGVSALQSTVVRFVSHIDPAAVFQFNYALDSVYATIGAALVPVLNTFTGILKTFAGAIAGAGAQGNKVIAALAAGTVGLIAFAAAMALMQAIATGGIAPIIGAVVGLFGGVALATGALKPIMDALAETLSGLLGVAGGAMDAIAGVVVSMVPMISQVVDMMAGMAGYLIEAFTRSIPTIMAIADVVMALAKPLMMLGMILMTVQAEIMLVVGELVSAFAPLIVLLGDMLGGAVKILGHVVMAVLPIFVYVATAITDTIKTIIRWVVELVRMIGFEIDDPFGERSGAPKGDVKTGQTPVRQAAYSDAMSDLRKAQAAAYSLGSGKKPDDRTADNTLDMVNKMGNMGAKFDGLIRWITQALPHYLVHEMPDEMYEKMKSVAGTIRDRVSGAVDGVGSAGVDTGAGKISVRDVTYGPAVDAAKWANRQLDIF